MAELITVIRTAKRLNTTHGPTVSPVAAKKLRKGQKANPIANFQDVDPARVGKPGQRCYVLGAVQLYQSAKRTNGARWNVGFLTRGGRIAESAPIVLREINYTGELWPAGFPIESDATLRAKFEHIPQVARVLKQMHCR